MAENGFLDIEDATWQRRLENLSSLLSNDDVTKIIEWFGLAEQRQDAIWNDALPTKGLFKELDKNDDLMSGDERTLNQILTEIGRDDLVEYVVDDEASHDDDDDPELTFAIDFLCQRVTDEMDWMCICRELGEFLCCTG